MLGTFSYSSPFHLNLFNFVMFDIIFSGALDKLYSKPFLKSLPISHIQTQLYSTNSDRHSENIVEFSHVDHRGNARMVDVSHKSTTKRQATATGKITLNQEAFRLLKDHQASHKGSVLSVAQLAGIMAAKQTSSLIPLCHNISLYSVEIAFNLDSVNFVVEVFGHVKCEGVTGCEMEAMTAVGVALLTVYDMTKSVAKDHIISDISLVEKSGGKSGHFSKM